MFALSLMWCRYCGMYGMWVAYTPLSLSSAEQTVYALAVLTWIEVYGAIKVYKELFWNCALCDDDVIGNKFYIVLLIFSPVGKQNIVMSQSVCLFDCSQIYLTNHMSKLHISCACCNLCTMGVVWCHCIASTFSFVTSCLHIMTRNRWHN